MVGGNFKLIEPIERWVLDGEMHLAFGLQSITRPGNPTYAIECRGFDFVPRRFKDVCLKAGIFVDLGGFDTEAKLGTLLEMIMGMAIEVALPEAATREGQVRKRIFEYVYLNMAAWTPEDAKPIHARVWLKEGRVYVEPHPLTTFLADRMRPHATGQEVWAQWEKIGGRSTGSLWWAPSQLFPEIVS
jgi:hypothetical protein